MTNPFNLIGGKKQYVNQFMGTDEYSGLINELNAITGGVDYNTYIQSVNDIQKMKEIAALQGKVYDAAYNYEKNQKQQQRDALLGKVTEKLPFLSGLIGDISGNVSNLKSQFPSGFGFDANPYYAASAPVGYHNGRPVYSVNQYTDPMLHYGNYELWNFPENYNLGSLNGQLVYVPMPDDDGSWMKDLGKALTMGLSGAVLTAAGGPVIGGALTGALSNFANSGGEASFGDILKSAALGAGAGYIGSQASGLIGNALSDLGASQAYNPSLGNLVLNGAQEYGSNLGSVFYGSAETPFIGSATSAFPTLAEQLGNVFYGTAATPLVTNGLMGNEGTDVNSIIKQALKVGSKALGGGEAPAVAAGASGGGMMSYTPSARQTGNTWATPAIQQENQSFNPSMVAANQANNLKALRNNLIQGNDDTRQDYLKSYIENIDKTDFLKNFYA